MSETLSSAPVESSTPESSEARDISQRVEDPAKAYVMAKASDFREMSMRVFQSEARKAAEKLENATGYAEEQHAIKEIENNTRFAESARNAADDRAEKAGELFEEAKKLRARVESLFPGTEVTTPTEIMAMWNKINVNEQANLLEQSSLSREDQDKARKEARWHLALLEDLIKHRVEVDAERSQNNAQKEDEIRA